jgi:hypothetical protein
LKLHSGEGESETCQEKRIELDLNERLPQDLPVKMTDKQDEVNIEFLDL